MTQSRHPTSPDGQLVQPANRCREPGTADQASGRAIVRRKGSRLRCSRTRALAAPRANLLATCRRASFRPDRRFPRSARRRVPRTGDRRLPPGRTASPAEAREAVGERTPGFACRSALDACLRITAAVGSIGAGAWPTGTRARGPAISPDSDGVSSASSSLSISALRRDHARQGECTDQRPNAATSTW